MERPLEMREEMRRSWLVQRLQIPRAPNPFSFGGGYENGGLTKEAMGLLRNIFSFDYMGSAEFEWGAVPNALQFLARQGHGEKNLVADMIVFPEGIVSYICPKQYEEEVKKRIIAWAHNKGETKEHVGLYEALHKDEWPGALGWLELDNGYMFFVDKDMFEKTKELLGCT